MIAQAEDDRVPLVALDPLDVLDEEPLLIGYREEPVERRIADLAEALVQAIVNVVCMALTEGNHSKRLLRRVLGMVKHEVDNSIGLVGIGPRPPDSCDGPERNRLIVDGAVDQRAGKRRQRPRRRCDGWRMRSARSSRLR